MSLPRYPEYEGSGIDWLGEVPSHWNISRLKANLTLQTEKAERRTNPIALENIESWTGRFIATASEFEGDGIAFQTGDILFGKLRPYLAKVYMADNFGEAIGDFHVLRPSSQMYGRFAQYQMLSRSFISIIGGSTFGSKMPRAAWEMLANMPFVAPSLVEQRSIATFLDRETRKIDTLITEQEKLIRLLAEKRQATISHGVSRGLNPHVPMNDSVVAWVGKVPAHWEVKRLKFVASVQTGIAKGKDVAGKKIITVPYLRVANVQDGFLSLEDIARIEIEPEQLTRYRLLQGDVLMNEGGDFDKLGRGAIWSGEVQDCIHQNHVFAVRPHSVDPRWLNQVTSSQYAQFYFMGRSKQSTNLASISSSNIMELPVILPPADEQADILSFIELQTRKLDALKAAAMRSIALLKERRSALITAAVTGQIDVRELESRVKDEEALAA